MAKLKQRKKNRVSSNQVVFERCGLANRTITNSFEYAIQDGEFGLRCFEDLKGTAANCAIMLFDKLRVISTLPWKVFSQKDKKSGCEALDVNSFPQSFINKVNENLPVKVEKDEKLFVVRFNGQNSRFIFKKDSDCDRLIYILGIDYNLKLYKH